MKKIAISLMLIVALTLIACQRNERSQGGTSGALTGSPAYNDPAITEADKAAPVVADVSASTGGTTVAAVMPVPGGGALDGHALFLANCSACHQATGQGVPGVFPPLDGSKYVTGDKVERLAAIMIYGLKGPVKVNGTTYNNVMLPLGKTLNDKELAAVASYVRGAWSNKASGLEATVFTKVRQQWGDRAQFEIAELGEEQ